MRCNSHYWTNHCFVRHSSFWPRSRWYKFSCRFWPKTGHFGSTVTPGTHPKLSRMGFLKMCRRGAGWCFISFCHYPWAIGHTFDLTIIFFGTRHFGLKVMLLLDRMKNSGMVFSSIAIVGVDWVVLEDPNSSDNSIGLCPLIVFWRTLDLNSDSGLL